jgi:cobaltochelatase CobN
MHRLATIPGGWNPTADGVIFVEQQPAPIVVITAADTDIQTLAAALAHLPTSFPAVRVVNLLQLQQQLTIDTYAEDVLTQAQVIIVRLIGGQSYWSYGLEVVEDTVKASGATLIVIPGDERPDPTLTSHSTAALTVVNQVWRYFIEAGIENYQNLLKFLATEFLDRPSHYRPPQPVPRIGLYGGEALPIAARRKVGILFYRAHYLSGNTGAIAALCDALALRDLTPVPIFVSSLKEPDVQAELQRYCRSDSTAAGIKIILNTTSFAIASLATDTPQVDLWAALDVPVLQVILSGGTQAAWQGSSQGLTPRDMAMNVVLPEVDGRIITRAVSFKAVQTQNAVLQTDVVVYEPEQSRINFVADLAAKWVNLAETPVGDRKIALILANYPNRDGRLANGVGLDTPASCLTILQALQAAGYAVGELPATSDTLMRQLIAGVTNDPEALELRLVRQTLSLQDYQAHFQTLSAAVQTGIQTRWGNPTAATGFAIAGIQFGNMFVGIQPSRGYDRDPSLNYHAPDLEPTHDYLAFYHWVNTQFGANAIVHVGKHGNLEWLPGKSVALSEDCYPEAVMGAMPHFYPFIVNDPGEGSQAKRRSQAVILDHLTPPMTRAELYGGLHQLEGLIDEYYEAQTLDPARVGLIRDRLLKLIEQENLHKDLGLATELSDEALTVALTMADGYLCELKEAQIRDGLHVFGQCPTGRQLRDLVVAIARNPNAQRLGLTRAIAADWQLDFDPLIADLGDSLSHPAPPDPALSHPAPPDPALSHPAPPDPAPPDPAHRLKHCRIVGDGVEVLEAQAADWVAALMRGETPETGEQTRQELAWVRDRLLPALYQTDQELINLLRGLDGHYIPSGASGAPTRGRPEVLPTGRNFYSVDIRAIPTETAWDIGRKAAEVLVERYTQEQGEYPKTLGLSMWGTATMRTGGDDLAEALALLGVKPVWDGVSRRVVDFEILPLALLGRPRVDVTLRISGFFRDAFPNLIDLFDSAVNAIANLKEPSDQNPLAAQVQQETQRWLAAGLTVEQAEGRSRYRIFGSKPSAYGAGLQGLIASQNWESDADLARAYINWSAYAYTRQAEGKSAPEAFTQRLDTLQIVLQNQDNREHDLLDSDDYYQFQGGLTAAVKAISGQMPEVYFGDNSQMAQPKVRKLSEEIARVYRSRVVNPKWIAGAMRHGYKGAFEMAATLDYLFAYDATTHCVEDFMYQGIAEAYVLDGAVQEFMQACNPWALRDMSERLLEAHQRGLWQQVDGQMLDRLRSLVNEAEGLIEAQHPGLPT